MQTNLHLPTYPDVVQREASFPKGKCSSHTYPLLIESLPRHRVLPDPMLLHQGLVSRVHLNNWFPPILATDEEEEGLGRVACVCHHPSGVKPSRGLTSLLKDIRCPQRVVHIPRRYACDGIPNGGKLVVSADNVFLGAHYAREHADVTPGEYVALTVNDTGIGMPEEVKAHVFEPFFTTKEPGKGTGLGLAMCYGIVKQNAGHIEVQSKLGEETTFAIYLPRVRGASEDLPEQDLNDALPRGTETMLVVEDDLWVRRMETMVLRQQGYHVLEAPNGNDALQLAREHARTEIALLVTDVIMPLMDGKELAGRLSTVRPAIKVLYASGYPDEIISRYGVLEEGIHFLQKPFTATELAVKVREVLDN